MATHHIYIEDIAEQLAAGFDAIKLYSDTEPDGGFTTLVATENLVADQLDYEINEASPTPGAWYRYLLYDNTGPVLTELSPPWQLNVVTAADILILASSYIGGFEGVCSAEGGAASLIDEALRDNSRDSDYLDGDWCLRPDAAVEADYVRRTSRNPFNPDTGEVSFIREWNTVPAEGERYAFFQRIPPLPARTGYSWMDALGDALADVEYPDEINLGPGTATGKSRFDLTPHSYVTIGRIYQVFGREIDNDGNYHEVDWDKNQKYWDVQENGPGQAYLDVFPAPATTQDVIMRVDRRFDRVYRLEDQTDCPLVKAARATVMKVYEFLNTRDGGNRWVAELAGATAAFNKEAAWGSTPTAVLGV